jgi:hypothetical protein
VRFGTDARAPGDLRARLSLAGHQAAADERVLDHIDEFVDEEERFPA